MSIFEKLKFDFAEEDDELSEQRDASLPLPADLTVLTSPLIAVKRLSVPSMSQHLRTHPKMLWK